jgi:uncharacterized protein
MLAAPAPRPIAQAMIVGAMTFLTIHPAPAAQLTEREMDANVEVVGDFFELMHRHDIDAWGELWADDGRILVPYPPEGFANEIVGKEKITSSFRTLFSNFASFDYEIIGLYPAADSDAVTVQYEVRASLVSGERYTNSNIAVFRFEGGRITAYHDYFDPRRFQVVVDALPAN